MGEIVHVYHPFLKIAILKTKIILAIDLEISFTCESRHVTI